MTTMTLDAMIARLADYAADERPHTLEQTLAALELLEMLRGHHQYTCVLLPLEKAVLERLRTDSTRLRLLAEGLRGPVH